MARSIATLYFVPLGAINTFNLGVTAVFSLFTNPVTVFLTLALLEGVFILGSVAAQDFIAATAARRFRFWNFSTEGDKKVESRIHRRRNVRLAVIGALLIVEFVAISRILA